MNVTRAAPLAAVLASALALVAPAAAGYDPCGADVVTINSYESAVYLVHRAASDGILFEAYVYCEANGTPGLQRGGPVLTGDVDPCVQSAVPDDAFCDGWP